MSLMPRKPCFHCAPIVQQLKDTYRRNEMLRDNKRSAELEALREVAEAARSAKYATAGGEGGPTSFAYPELRDALAALDKLTEGDE